MCVAPSCLDCSYLSESQHSIVCMRLDTGGAFAKLAASGSQGRLLTDWTQKTVVKLAWADGGVSSEHLGLPY